MKSVIDTVLLIDDDDITNLYNKKILEVTSFAKKVVAHQSAENALDYLNANKFVGVLPELIFLDIRMPEMDGYAFLDALDKMKGEFKKTPKVVILSSLVEDQDQKRASKSHRVLNILEKPLNESKLKTIKLSKDE